MPVRTRKADSKQIQANGLYIHSSPPRVLQLTSAHIKQLIRSGDVEKLEQLVVDGHGKKLVGEYSADYKTRTFLKNVPNLMTKISLLHDAVNSGRLEELQSLLDEEPIERRKRLVTAKDDFGVGLLHKAIYYDLKNIYKYLIDKFPHLVPLKDSEGRTAFHYTPMCKDAAGVQKLLISAGADSSCLDQKQRTAKYYMTHIQELELPNSRKSATSSSKTGPQHDGLNFKKSNIRIWIHQRNLLNLQQVVWEGHGAKLLPEHSNNPKIKKFLEAVPHIMGIIKDIHSDVINDELESLKKRLEPPIPPLVLSGKDSNGLTPLHKASGLGKQQIAEFLLAEYPNCVNLVDSEGRTPLHYAALLKDDGQMMSFLLEHGADESALDNRQKTAAYYKTRASELDSKLLSVIPEAPRTAKESFLGTFDWSLLLAATPTEEIQKEESPTEESKKEGVETEENIEENGHKPEEEEKIEQQNGNDEHNEESNDNNEEEEVNDNKVEEEEKEDEENNKEEEEPNDNKVEEEETNQDNTVEDENEPEETNNNEPERPESAPKSPEPPKIATPEVPPVEPEEVIEGVVNGENEIETLNEQGQDSNSGDENTDPEITEMVESGNMEQLAALVLNGEGERLVGQTSDNPELQSFLDNVQVYMSKINRIHVAARDGSLRDLQAALDRRKFAIAKDKVSPNGASPLHVAVVFTNTSIVRYLAGRFPETAQVTDNNGRTPLHYAAVLPDNGHYYNLLIHLGADSRTEDKFGHSPEYYRSHQEDFSHRTLLREFGAEESASEEMLSDKVVFENSSACLFTTGFFAHFIAIITVVDDTCSARKDLDDEDMLNVLERCYNVLHGRRNSNTVSAASNASSATNVSYTSSIIAKHTKRYVFDAVKNRMTKLDHNLYDVIWPSVKKLPSELSFRVALEQDFPAGIVAPDVYVYKVFKEYLEPIIKEYNAIDVRHELGVHPATKFVQEENGNLVDVEFDLDPQARWIISGTLDCTRNLLDFELPKSLNVNQLETVERLVTSVLLSPELGHALYPNASEDDLSDGCGVYYTMNEVLEDPSEARVILASNGLLIPLWNIPESDRLHGKHWPYGRGVFITNGSNLAVWINVLDHIRIVTCSPHTKPGNIGLIYSRIARLDSILQKHLEFKRDEKLGYLSARPTCVGNTLQFNFTLRFPNLSKQPDNLRHLCFVRGLTFNRKTNTSDIVRIGNQQSLGVCEYQSFEDFTTAFLNILQLEKDLAVSNSLHIAAAFVNMFKRKKMSLAE
ncbi:hypothetical protein TcasGA2_TC034478 [Tribolium castaneum]|uniref:Arginine kinase n=1 Tax=Tribolium castaneum TaxID=7070 RepID=A0A139WBY4_TRICA|nr:hypothetical protein TcasGA2_TC034478 [Tribolium castaneum]